MRGGSSHSKAGTKKTTEFISRDSEKYIDRVYNRPGAPQGEKGMGQKGSLADGTDAAHKLSWGLMNAFVTHTPGRPFGEEKSAAIAREMNSSETFASKAITATKHWTSDVTPALQRPTSVADPCAAAPRWSARTKRTKQRETWSRWKAWRMRWAT